MSIFVALDTIERESKNEVSYWKVYEIAERAMMENPGKFMEWISILHDEENPHPLPYTFFQTIVCALSHEESLIREFVGREIGSVMFSDIDFPRHMKTNRFGRMVSGSGCRGEDIRRSNTVLNSYGVPTDEIISGTLAALLEIRETGEYINPDLAEKMMDRMFWSLSEKSYAVLYLTAIMFYTRIVCNYRFTLPSHFYDDPRTLSELISHPDMRNLCVPDEMCWIDGEFELERICYREANMLTSDYPEEYKGKLYLSRGYGELFPGMRDFHSHQEIIATPGSLLCVSYGDQIHKIKLDYERMTEKQASTTRDLVVPFVKNLSEHLVKREV
jgi:hypothetical protein